MTQLEWNINVCVMKTDRNIKSSNFLEIKGKTFCIEYDFEFIFIIITSRNFGPPKIKSTFSYKNVYYEHRNETSLLFVMERMRSY